MIDKTSIDTYPVQEHFIDKIGFQPKQIEAIKIAIDHKYTLYGGSAGGGKSFWLRWGLVYLLIRIFRKYGFKGVQAGLFCEDYVTLQDRQLSKIASEFPAWLGTLKNDCFTLSEQFGGGKIVFRNLDDTSKYRSAEFALIGIDELTMNYQQVFEDMRFRLRWVDNETKQELPYMECKFLGGTNPTGRGMGWVKKLWIERDFSEYASGMSEDDFENFCNSFAFVQARYVDNKYMLHYEKTLSSLEEKMRKALRDGSWDIFEGQFFLEFTKSTHTVNAYQVHYSNNCFVSLDYGYSAPSCALFHSVDPDDNVIVYKELYKTGLTPTKLAKEIFDMTTHEERRAIQYIVADPAMWSKTGERDGIPISNVELMQGEFNRLGWAIGIIKADNDRVIGWGVVREHLNLNQSPHVIIFNNCTNLVRTLGSVVYAKNRQDDLDSSGEDHAPDSLRYGLMSRPHHQKTEERMYDSEVATRLLLPTAEQIQSTLLNLDRFSFDDTILNERVDNITSDYA